MRAIPGSNIFGGKFPQVVTVLTATIGAISDGMQYAWTAPIIPVLQAPGSPVPIDKSDEMWLETLYMIGGLAGLPITIFCVDQFGRKNSIIIAAITHLVSWLLSGIATNTATLYCSRFLAGLAEDVAFVAGPMFVAEIADKNIRGLLSGFIYVALLVGIIVLYSVAPFVSIVVTSCVGASFVVVQLLTFSFMPESPYYLLLKDKKEKARKSLQFIRGKADVDAELQEITAAVERQAKERGRPLDLVTDPGNRKAITIMTVLNASQHFSSISVMLMNLHLILNDAAGILKTDYAGIIFSVTMFLSSLVAIIVVDKFGRKKLVIFSSLATGISLAILATYFAVKDSGANVATYNWVPIVAVLLYAVSFKCGLGIVPIVLTGELFPTSVKAMGMTVSDAMYVIFGTLSIYLYQALSHQYGIYCPFYLFSASCILTALFSIFYIPETNGKTLEEIQFILKGLPPEPQKDNQQQQQHEVWQTKL